MNAPSFRELLRDPVVGPYLRQVPTLFANVRWGEPWVVVGKRDNGDGTARWFVRKHEKYTDAFNLAIRSLKESKVDDVAVVSRRQGFAPPRGFVVPRGLNWCGRCRRPVRFMYARSHVLLRGAPVVTSDDSIRCPWCGMRKAAMPRYD